MKNRILVIFILTFINLGTYAKAEDADKQTSMIIAFKTINEISKKDIFILKNINNKIILNNREIPPLQFLAIENDYKRLLAGSQPDKIATVCAQGTYRLIVTNSENKDRFNENGCQGSLRHAFLIAFFKRAERLTK